MNLRDTEWRRSSRSGENGGDCVEVASVSLSEAAWRKATRSLNNGGDCVEISGGRGVVAVRDSKDPDGPILLVTPRALRAAVLAPPAAG